MTTFMITENIDITHLTTFGIEVKAKYFAEYSSVKELESIMKTPEYQQNEILHIGGGSNLLFVNDFNGLVLHSAIKGLTAYRKNAETVYLIAGAGEKWVDVVKFSIDEGLRGLENLAHIPGEVGASPIQNVGAYGVEAGDFIFKVECYDRLSHKIVNFSREECRFGYRDSMFKHEGRGRYFILRVCFRLTPGRLAQHLDYGPLKTLAERLGHEPTTQEVSDEITLIRQSKLPDPAVLGSAGSFFKNPVVRRKYYEAEVLKHCPNVPCYDLPDELVKIPAGWLIEHAGLKGVSIGGAQVYEKQCLVITNKGGATGVSVEALSRHIQLEVHRKFGLWLTPEVNFIDTSVHIEVLGSGTSKGVPEPACQCNVCTSANPYDKRLRASVLIKTHGLSILIDASPDFRYQAIRSGIYNIDATLITHQHYDHVGGIDDLRPYCTNSHMPLFSTSLVADDLRRRLDYCFRKEHYPGVPGFDMHEVGDNPFYIRGLKIIPIKVMHASLPIVGYRIGDFAYITDAKTIPAEEMSKLTGVRLLIINALRPTPHFSHLTLDEAIALIKQIKPKQAYLTHICHDMGRHAEVEKRLPQGIHLAYDGLRLTVD